MKGFGAVPTRQEFCKFLSFNLQWFPYLMALLAAAVWIILLAITGQQTECFNLDQNDDVVRFFTGGNEPNSLFGFSLAPYSFSDNHTRYVVARVNQKELNLLDISIE